MPDIHLISSPAARLPEQAPPDQPTPAIDASQQRGPFASPSGARPRPSIARQPRTLPCSEAELAVAIATRFSMIDRPDTPPAALDPLNARLQEMLKLPQGQCLAHRSDIVRKRSEDAADAFAVWTPDGRGGRAVERSVDETALHLLLEEAVAAAMKRLRQAGQAQPDAGTEPVRPPTPAQAAPAPVPAGSVDDDAADSADARRAAAIAAARRDPGLRIYESQTGARVIHCQPKALDFSCTQATRMASSHIAISSDQHNCWLRVGWLSVIRQSDPDSVRRRLQAGLPNASAADVDSAVRLARALHGLTPTELKARFEGKFSADDENALARLTQMILLSELDQRIHAREQENASLRAQGLPTLPAIDEAALAANREEIRASTMDGDTDGNSEHLQVLLHFFNADMIAFSEHVEDFRPGSEHEGPLQGRSIEIAAAPGTPLARIELTSAADLDDALLAEVRTANTNTLLDAAAGIPVLIHTGGTGGGHWEFYL